MAFRHFTGGFLVAILGFSLVTPQKSMAASQPNSVSAAAPTNLNLTASPYIVDVGGNVALTVTAQHWSGPASVKVSFLAPHHGFSGNMVWAPQCSCFRLNVFLAKRIHALELARVTATVTIGKTSYIRRNTFQVRGLLSNGKTFAPGGTPYLASWVNNPQPVQNEFVHFCAWTRALDSFPVSGVPVSFVVHFQQRTQRWFAGLTANNGVRCSNKNIFHAKIGVPVTVDVYAGKLHGRTTFTPISG